MESLEPKKLALVRILQILQKYSDRDHPLRQEDIVQRLKQEYGLTIERKAIGRNLSLLREAGFEIKSARAGSYLDERTFTDAELRILIDGVLSSKYITAKYSRDLIDKLCGLSNRYFRSHVRYIYSVGEWDKTDNQALFCSIELVDEAIEKRKQICFDYNKYGIDKRLHKTHTHYASPYQLILHNQRYYLMARDEYWKNLVYYRLDRITNMRITDQKLEPITTIEGYEGGINYKELSTALPYMFSDKPEWVEFTADRHIIDQIIDWFGKDIRIRQNAEDPSVVRIFVKVSLSAMEHWAMQYAGNVCVTAPRELAEKIKNRLHAAAEMYDGEQGT